MWNKIKQFFNKKKYSSIFELIDVTSQHIKYGIINDLLIDYYNKGKIDKETLYAMESEIRQLIDDVNSKVKSYDILRGNPLF